MQDPFGRSITYLRVSVTDRCDLRCMPEHMRFLPGTLYMRLGQDDAADLRRPLRAGASDAELEAAIREAIRRKPRGHDFVIDRRQHVPAVARHMSLTGG